MLKWKTYGRVLMMTTLAFVVLLSACGQAAPQATPDTPAGVQVTKVALLLPGAIADGGWSQLAYEGLVELGRDNRFQIAYAEDISQARIPEVTRGYADDAFDLIIGHGFEFGSAFLEIAPDYPSIWFFATTFAPQENIPDNLQFVDAVYFDAAYSAGALAALLSENHVVGFVGGGDNPTQQGMMRAFIAGAENTVPATMGLGIVTGDYNDAAKGREAAATMIGNGADVIWHAADITGLGAIEGAVASQALVLGCYSDQTHLAPGHMGSSLVMDLAAMVVKLANDVRDGSYRGGIEWQPTVKEMWHWQAGGGSYNSDIIPNDVWTQFMQIWEDLAAKRIQYDIN
jgi:basic membrane protein A and related proteins